MGSRQKHKIRANRYGSEPFIISLKHLDRGEDNPWPFDGLDEADMQDLGALFAEIGLDTWESIETIKKGETSECKHAFRGIDSITRCAQGRIESMGQNVAALAQDGLFRFSVTNEKRLWGFKVDATFYILWWDPHHQVAK